MKRMRFLVLSILSLYSINVVLAGSRFIKSIIRQNSNTLVGAAITNKTSLIAQLLDEMHLDDHAVEEVLDALDQAKWYNQSAAKSMLNKWLMDLEQTGVVIPWRKGSILPHSLLGEKCLCKYVGDGHAWNAHGWGAKAHGEHPVDDELAARLEYNDYQGLQVYLKGLKTTPSSVNAVSRAAQEAERLNYTKSVFELNAWLSAAQSDAFTTTDQQMLGYTRESRRTTSDPVSKDRGWGSDEQSSTPAGSLSGPQAQGFGTHFQETSIGSSDAINPSETSNRQLEGTTSSNGTMSGYSTNSGGENSFKRQRINSESQDPSSQAPHEGNQNQSEYQSVSYPSGAQPTELVSTQPTKPLRSILKPAKPVSNPLSPALEEALSDMARCPHCGQPISQDSHSNPIRTVKLISIRQVDPRGQAVLTRTKPLPNNSITQEQPQHSSLPDQLSYAPEPTPQQSQPPSSRSISPIPIRSPVGDNPQKQASSGPYSYASSEGVPVSYSTRVRPVIDDAYIKRNSQEVGYIPEIPVYRKRVKRSSRSGGTQSIQQSSNSQSPPTLTSSPTFPSLSIVPPEEAPVKKERTPTGLISITSETLPSSSPDQTPMAQDPPSIGSHALTQSPIPFTTLNQPSTSPSSQIGTPIIQSRVDSRSDLQSPTSTFTRKGSFLKGDTYDGSLDHRSQDYDILLILPDDQTVSTSTSNQVVAPGVKLLSENERTDLSQLQELVCDPSRAKELKVKVNNVSYEVLRQLSTFNGCTPDIMCQSLPIIVPKLLLDDCEDMMHFHKDNQQIIHCINESMTKILDDVNDLLRTTLPSDKDLITSIIATYISDDDVDVVDKVKEGIES